MPFGSEDPTLLRPDLHHAAVPECNVNHPSPLPDEQRERLLDVDVLARGAGQHGHERVPVIRGRDNHRIDLPVIEQGPKVGMPARLAAGKRKPFVATAAVHLRDAQERRRRADP